MLFLRPSGAGPLFRPDTTGCVRLRRTPPVATTQHPSGAKNRHPARTVTDPEGRAKLVLHYRYFDGFPHDMPESWKDERN